MNNPHFLLKSCGRILPLLKVLLNIWVLGVNNCSAKASTAQFSACNIVTRNKIINSQIPILFYYAGEILSGLKSKITSQQNKKLRGQKALDILFHILLASLGLSKVKTKIKNQISNFKFLGLIFGGLLNIKMIKIICLDKLLIFWNAVIILSQSKRSKLDKFNICMHWFSCT